MNDLSVKEGQVLGLKTVVDVLLLPSRVGPRKNTEDLGNFPQYRNPREGVGKSTPSPLSSTKVESLGGLRTEINPNDKGIVNKPTKGLWS